MAGQSNNHNSKLVCEASHADVEMKHVLSTDCHILIQITDGYPLVTGKAIKNRKINFAETYNISAEP